MNSLTRKIASTAIAAVAAFTMIGGGAASAAPQAPAKTHAVAKADKAKADKAKADKGKNNSKAGSAQWESNGGEVKHHFKPRR
jgi:hypothetical protein